MEARELRIGNWYQNKSNDEKLKFQQVTFFEDAHYVAVYCDPIPLTEEWLHKFGFNSKYKSVHMHWNLGPFELNQKSNEDDEHNIIPQEQIWYFSHAGWTPDVLFVHQLQNIYFALTGLELELKERGEKV